MIGAFSQSRDFRFGTLPATFGLADNRTFHSVYRHVPKLEQSLLSRIIMRTAIPKLATVEKNITLQRRDFHFRVKLIPPASRSDNVEHQVLRFCNSLAHVLHVFEVARPFKGVFTEEALPQDIAERGEIIRANHHLE
jgi:hypothetical protein